MVTQTKMGCQPVMTRTLCTPLNPALPCLPQPDPSMWGSCARSYLKKLRKDLDVPGLLLALLYTPGSFYNNPCGCNNPNSG